MKEFIDKLISKFKKVSFADIDEQYADDGQMMLFLHDAISIVNELAEEYKVSEMPTGWIPCERELPKEGKKVLVTYEDRYIGGHNGVCEGMYVYGWKEWDISDYMCKDDFRVIAWCELPAPYTEGE